MGGWVLGLNFEDFALRVQGLEIGVRIKGLEIGDEGVRATPECG